MENVMIMDMWVLGSAASLLVGAVWSAAMLIRRAE